MKILAAQFANWQAALDDFQKSVEKDLEEIRRCKREVRQMKFDLIDQLGQGRYIRDEHRVIISAPEIIIGNVDRSGVLCGNYSKVIIRGNEIGLDGVGLDATSTGSIVSRASSIQQIAVDPGIDGEERVVKGTSEIISQARNVVIRGEKSMDYFTSQNLAGLDGGIVLSTDGQIRVDATLSNEALQEALNKEEKNLTSQVGELKKQVSQAKSEASSFISKMNDLVAKDVMNLDETTTRTNFVDIEELHDEFQQVASALYNAMSGYFNSLSRLAEFNRQLNSLKKQKEAASKRKSTFKEKTTGTSVSIRSENINLISMDGDGRMRTNKGAGIAVAGKQVSVSSYGDDSALIKDSEISIASQQVEINTANPKVSGKNKEFPADGQVRVVSKDIQFESVDYESKDGKIQEKSLTKEGAFTVRAEKIGFSATDTEGKAIGSVAANAKKVEVKAMDVDKEKRTDKSLAAGSALLLLAEQVYAGSKDKKTKSKSFQVASDKVGVFGDTTVELQQDGKAVVQLSGGDVSMSGSKTTLYGEMTSQGKTTFKSDVTAGTVDVKNLKVDSSFKTPYTTEGISVSGAPSTAKLSAKLSEEEMKSEK